MTWHSILRTTRGFPLKVFLAIVAGCLILREEFPFSDFPMYSSFDNYTFYVYITDGEENPIPVETITGQRTGKLKKIYQDELDKLRDRYKAEGRDWEGFQFLTAEEKRDAGRYTLEWLYQNAKESGRETLRELAPLAFHQVGLRVGEEGEFVSEDEAIASAEAPPP